MRTTIAIDDELFAKAQEFAGVTEKSAVIREALKAFVEREAGSPARPDGRHAAERQGSAAPPLQVMVLADTSIWIDHFRRSDLRLAQFLDRGDIAMHPFVIGELLLGHVPKIARDD